MHQSELNRSIPNLIKERSNPILRTRGTSEFYGIAEEREGNVIALKFITNLGEQKAIHYHDIISPMDYNGDSEIRLMTTRVTVIIKGSNLDDLFDYIIQHQVKWIREPEDSFPQGLEEGDLEITSIRFEATTIQ
ncbi:MAG: hypothetical protein H6573_32840 [Lewinellaceae bacterium]|nr:hypothetical protein [Lewinellaceae bacterium]